MSSPLGTWDTRTVSLLRLTIRCTVLVWDTPLPHKGHEVWILAGNTKKKFGLDGHTFETRWKGGNNYSISRIIFGYDPKLSL